jgi:UDP-glucose 4-epimerase
LRPKRVSSDRLSASAASRTAAISRNRRSFSIAAENGSTGIFNLGWGRGANILQICSELKAIIGYPLQPNYGPPKTGETFKIYLDATRARQQMGWQPTVSLTDGLRQTVDYFRQKEVPAG